MSEIVIVDERRCRMSDITVLAVIISSVSLVIAPLVSYMTVSRRLSGKIQSSEAIDLWKESASIREDYRRELIRAVDQIENLRESNLQLRTELNEMKIKVSNLTNENEHLKNKIVDLGGTA